MISLPLSPNPSIATPPKEICKSIVFQIMDYVFALPVDAVFKVIQLPRSPNQCASSSEVLLLNDIPISYLNLYPCLPPLTSEQSPRLVTVHPDGSFCFLIAYLPNQTLGAIPVDHPPSLFEIDLSTVHLLPPSHRQILGDLATHVAIVPSAKSTTTIFLLDLQKALQFHQRNL